MNRKILLFAALIGFLSACQKEKTMQEALIETQESNLKSSPIPSTYFDWEKETSYQGLSLPWNTFTNSFIPNSWKHNHKKADGWELLYNTLDRPEVNVGKFFALYNKYLGVLRIFFIKTENVNGGQKYTLAAAINGNTILFNNENDEFSLNPINNPTVIKTQPLILNNIAASQGFIQNAWYGTEFHFEYENISGRNNIFLQLIPYKSKIENVKLQSETTGGITGTIQTNASSSSSSSLIGSLGINFSGKKGKAKTDTNKSSEKIAENLEDSKKENPKFFNELWEKVKKETPGFAQDNIMKTVKNVVNLGLNWASNPIMSFAKSAFGIGSSSTPTTYDVNLKVKTNTITSGTISSVGTLGNFTLALPTTNLSNGGYGYPTTKMQDFGVGVWTLNEMPTALIHRNRIIYTKNHVHVTEPARTIFQFSIKNKNKIHIIYNPKVLADCEILKESIRYSFGYDRMSENHQFILNYSTPFKYDKKEYFELDYIKMYDYDRYVHSIDRILNIEAHVAITLKHKVTGKTFNHIKTIKLPVENTSEINYLEIGEGDEGILLPPDGPF